MLRHSYSRTKIVYFRLGKFRYSTEIENQNASKSNEVSKPKRPIKNEPFIKNLFVGKYERNYLKFPELNSKELRNLESFIKPIEKYYLEDAKSFGKEENFCENFSKLKTFQLNSLTTPIEFGN